MLTSDFGSCLTRLLAKRQCSIQALAQELHVDRSLVDKWRRGERTPHPSSDYVARIAAVLALPTEEREALEAAQFRSLQSPRTSRPRKTTSTTAVQQLLHVNSTVETLTTEATHSPAIDGAEAQFPRHLDASTLMMDPQHGVYSPTSASGCGAIRGRTAIVQAIFEIIDGAPAPTDPSDQAASTILITSQIGSNWNAGEWAMYSDYSQRWDTVVKRAIARGWRFCHLIRIDKNAQRSLEMARLTLDLMGTGRYTMMYVYGNDQVLPACELAVIPDVAAIQFLATKTMNSVDMALILKDRQQIAALQEYFQLMAARAKPLLQVFPAADWIALETHRAEAEEQYGARVLVKDGLSRLTEPPSWANSTVDRARLSALSEASQSVVIEARKRRLAAFETHVGRSRYRDICPMRSVIGLVQEGRYLQSATDSSVVAMPIVDRIAHLEYLIALLRMHDYYELALVDETQAEEIPILPDRFWEVIGGMRVFANILVHDPQGSVQHAGLLMSEPSLVGAFQQYFDDLWGRIAPRDKDKEYVIWWLGRQVELLHSLA